MLIDSISMMRYHFKNDSIIIDELTGEAILPSDSTQVKASNPEDNKTE